MIAREFDRPFETTESGSEFREPEVPTDVIQDEYFVYIDDDAAEPYRFQSQWIVEVRSSPGAGWSGSLRSTGSGSGAAVD